MRSALIQVLVGLLFLAIPMSTGADPGRPAVDPAKSVDPDYATAEKAIKGGDYAGAIKLLDSVVARDANNADAYNWLGYATRKGGDPAKSIPIYQKALSINPEHRGAHEYIGEAYLQLNDVAKAREHLARLDKLCFFSCEEYRDLKKAVEAYEKKNGKK